MTWPDFTRRITRIALVTAALVPGLALHAQKDEATRFDRLVDDARTRIQEIDAAMVTRALRETPGSQIIDIRERLEIRQGAYPGAIHLPGGVLEWRIESLIPDPSTTIILYCGGGRRSALAADSLGRMGYADVRSVRHGWPALREVFFEPNYDELLRADLAAPGEVSRITSPYGSYVAYMPVEPPRQILVIAHGYPYPDDSRTPAQLFDHAEAYVERWQAFADQHQLVLLAPLFGSGALAGYRELFGTVIDADRFVIELVSAFGSAHVEDFDRRFVLYGHSAGGQFASRFLAMHPDRLNGVVLSAPGRYAMPHPGIPWPHGSAPTTRDALLSGDRVTKMSPALAEGHRFVPAFEGWVDAACELPIRVVVGLDDLDLQGPAPGHDGRTRVDYARNYVERMRDLAERFDCTASISLHQVEGVGHDPVALTETCQREIASLFER